jgi:NitT/TauT family transport system substrate-binding protein
MFKRLAAAVLAIALASGAQAQSSPIPDAGPIEIHGNKQTFEIAPVLLAAEKFYPGNATVKMGGIPNLVGEPIVPGFGEEGVADIATHAETQALRYSVKHPNLRIVMNVTQGLYRIVARKSAGIASVADLKGKRIVTIAPTSSGYFLRRMLAREGLSFADIVPTSLQPGTPLSAMPGMLARGEADAVVIWEPESENSLLAIGDDAIEFRGDDLYSEQFNLNTTAENLADPTERAKIVAFLRAVIRGGAEVRREPAEAKRLVVAAGGFKPEEVERSWKHHAFNTDYPANMLDILAAEEQWLALQDKRRPRSREELAKLIDMSAYQEALALENGR